MSETTNNNSNQNSQNLEFIGNIPSGMSASPQSVGGSNPLGTFGDEVTNEFADALKDNARKAGIPTTKGEAARLAANVIANQLVKQVGNKINSGIIGGSGYGGTNGPVGPAPSGPKGDPSWSMSHQHGSTFDWAIPPAEWSYNDDIIPNIMPEYYQRAQNGLASPLHLSHVKFIIEDNPGISSLSYWIKNSLYPQFVTTVQSAVTFNIPLTNIVYANYISYLNVVGLALQTYYFYDSVMQYSNFPENQNEGMRSLNSQLTAQDRLLVGNLKKTLESHYLPPRMISWISWMSQTFISGEAPGSPIIKICPVAFADSSTGYSNTLNTSSTLTSLISDLNNNAVLNISAVLARACPDWKVYNLPGSAFTPIYDTQFITMFANLPYQFGKTAATSYSIKGPVAADASAVIQYHVYGNSLNGSYFASSSAYVTSMNTWFPGLLQPIVSTFNTTTGVTSSRSNWYVAVDGSGRAFYDAYSNPVLAVVRNETYIHSTTYTETICSGGFERAENVNANGICQTAYAFVEYLFSIDTIQNRANLNHRRDYPKGPRKQQRKY